MAHKMCFYLFCFIFLNLIFLRLLAEASNPDPQCSTKLPDNECENIRQVDFVIILDYVHSNDSDPKHGLEPNKLDRLYNKTEIYLTNFLENLDFKYGEDDVRVAVIRTDEEGGTKIRKRGQEARAAMLLKDYTKNVFDQIQQPYARLVSGDAPHLSLLESLQFLETEVLTSANGDRPDVQNMVMVINRGLDVNAKGIRKTRDRIKKLQETTNTVFFFVFWHVKEHDGLPPNYRDNAGDEVEKWWWKAKNADKMVQLDVKMNIAKKSEENALCFCRAIEDCQFAKASIVRTTCHWKKAKNAKGEKCVEINSKRTKILRPTPEQPYSAKIKQCPKTTSTETICVSTNQCDADCEKKGWESWGKCVDGCEKIGQKIRRRYNTNASLSEYTPSCKEFEKGSCTTCDRPPPKNERDLTTMYLAIAVVSLFCLVVLVFVIFFIKKRRQKKNAEKCGGGEKSTSVISSKSDSALSLPPLVKSEGSNKNKSDKDVSSVSHRIKASAKRSVIHGRSQARQSARSKSSSPQLKMSSVTKKSKQ